MAATARTRDAGKLRVIAGIFRGRKLIVPPGDLVRPTADKVREALFDILGPRVVGARFLDACAGTGAIGIEALSRGASSVTFVEKNREIAAHLKRNIEIVSAGQAITHMPRMTHMTHLIVGDIIETIPILERENRRFDIIYLDPPYTGGQLGRAVRAICGARLMREGSMLVAEHDSKSEAPSDDGFAAVRTVAYGRTALSFFAR
jgi:16S rRNA (guanine(966)-N(2))-methyltransferase RsmD